MKSGRSQVPLCTRPPRPLCRRIDSEARYFRRPKMIVEVRSYRIKPGRREEFIRLFETRAVPALREHGMKVLGPLLDVENPNKFVWLRSFPSLAERDRMKDDFYEGELWKR